MLVAVLISVANAAKPVKVFILAGQSNMEGQGVVSMDDQRDYNGGKGNLVWSMKNSKSAEKMKILKDKKGGWVVRDDVQISFILPVMEPLPNHRFQLSEKLLRSSIA